MMLIGQSQTITSSNNECINEDLIEVLDWHNEKKMVYWSKKNERPYTCLIDKTQKLVHGIQLVQLFLL